MPGHLAKPVSPRVYRRAGAPSAWFLMGSPRREGAGGAGDVADLTGGTPAGVRSSGCTWAHGPTGNCLSFDGSSRVATSTTLPFGTGDFIIAFSMNSPPAGFVIPVGKDNGNTRRDWAVCLNLSSPGSLDWFDYHALATVTASGATSVGNGTWRDVAVVRRSGAISFFVDGVEYAGGANTTNYDVPGNIYLGGREGAANDFIGSLDNVRVHTRALSSQEIARDYADPYWRLRPTFGVAVMQASSGSTANFYDPFGGPTGHPLVSGGLVR